MLTTSIALLVAVSGAVQARAGLPGSEPVRLVQVDSAHTLFTSNAPDAGRIGQLYQLPQGGFGVSSGGTPYYQTLGTLNGGIVAVPNGNTTFGVIGSGGRIGSSHTRG